MPNSRTSLALLALTLGATFASAQTPYLGYDFTNSLAPTVGTGPSLVSNGGTVDADSYDFGAGQGLSLPASALESTSNYTIHLGFSFSDMPGYNKIIDFTDRSQDQGLYFREGQLSYYGGSEGTTIFSNDQFVQVTLVRDGTTNEVRGYVNGVREFSFADPGFAATFIGTDAWFFRDDNRQGSEHSGGSADFVRFYSGALSDAQVQAIATTPVPEPATMAALGLGALALLKRRRTK